MSDRGEGETPRDATARPAEPAKPASASSDREALERQKLILENRKLELEIREFKTGWIRYTATFIGSGITVAGLLITLNNQAAERKRENRAQAVETNRVAEEKYAEATGQLSSPGRIQRVQAVTYLAQTRDLSPDIWSRSLTALCQQLEAEPDPAVLEQVIWSIRQFAPDLGADKGDSEHNLRQYDQVLRSVANANRRSAATLARNAGRWIGARILERPGAEAASLARLQARNDVVEPAVMDAALARRARHELDILASHVRRVPMVYEQNALAGLGVSFDLRDMFQPAGMQNRCRDEIVDLIFHQTLSHRGRESATDSLLATVDGAGMHLAATSFCLRRLLDARGTSRAQNNLQGVVLAPVSLRNTNLAGIDFTLAYVGALLEGANLDSCRLGSAIVYGRMDATTLVKGAHLEKALFPDSLRACRPGAIPDISGSNWREARVGRIVPFDSPQTFNPPEWSNCASPH